MLKAKDLIKERYRNYEFKYQVSDATGVKEWQETSVNETLKQACIGVAYELYLRKADLTINTFAAYLLVSEYRGRVMKLAARFEREFLNEEYSEPDLDENSALLTLYVDAKNDILYLENIIKTTTLPYYMVKELEKNLYSWCRFEKLNKKSGFYKILACIDERDSEFDSTTFWYFEVRNYRQEMNNES